MIFAKFISFIASRSIESYASPFNPIWLKIERSFIKFYCCTAELAPLLKRRPAGEPPPPPPSYYASAENILRIYVREAVREKYVEGMNPSSTNRQTWLDVRILPFVISQAMPTRYLASSRDTCLWRFRYIAFPDNSYSGFVHWLSGCRTACGSIDIPANARGRCARIAFHESPRIAAPLDLVYINYALKRDPPQGVRGEQMCGDLETSRANVEHLCAAWSRLCVWGCWFFSKESIFRIDLDRQVKNHEKIGTKKSIRIGSIQNHM